MRRLATVIALLAIAVLAGCTHTTDGKPSPSGPHPGDSVGKLVLDWKQSGTKNDPVDQYVQSTSGAVLIKTTQELDSWRTSLPTEFLTEYDGYDLDKIDLSKSVVVVASYTKCQQESQIIHQGGGTLSFDVFIPPSKTNQACAWSPVVVELWQVTYQEIGVQSADDVELA